MLRIYLDIEDRSHTPGARNAAREMAHLLNFDEAGVERAAIVVTEVCTNLVKHAGGGSISLSINRQNGIDLLAMDRGPGMVNLGECLADGFNAAGMPSTGLGAIARLSAFSDAYSQAGRGTVLHAVIGERLGRIACPGRVCGVQAPKPGQDVCGDAWSWKEDRVGHTVMVADGLGQGPGAAAASHRAVEIFTAHRPCGPAELLASIHAGLRETRGAAVSIATLDSQRRVVNFAGLGHVAGFVAGHDAPKRQMVSMNGTAGLERPGVFREFSYPWPQGAAVVLHSGGVAAHWTLDDCPALLTRGPALIAGVLFRDFRRLGDDATVVCMA